MRFSEAKKKFTGTISLAAAGLVLLCLASAAWSADSLSVSASEPAGSITSFVPRAGAVREGTKTPLAVGDGIFAEDSLFTDETGQMEITFLDGTTLDLGPLSEVHVRDFTMTEQKNSFHSDLLRGAARLVTGDLVKRNPGGFRISTPRSTIGIRGTEVLLVVRGGDEILMVPVLGGRREGDPAGASDHSRVTVIDKQTGQMHKITEPGWVFTRSGSGPARLTKPSPEKRAAIDVLIRMTGVPNEEISEMPADFHQNVDKVLEENPDEPEQTPEAPPAGSSGRNGPSPDGPSQFAPDGGNRADDGWKNELPGESVVGAGDPRIGKNDESVKIGAEPVIPIPRVPSVCD
ncbi:MAG: FecR family protein [Synergistaceae bacterium]|jgi:hypothetical protein|nr:FecR family protein [Synergistaceae bacterium]